MGNKSSNKKKDQAVDETDGKKKKIYGPTKDRGCTDIVCCVIFSLYMIGMVIVAIVGIKEGSPKRLLYPTDSNGKVCGSDFPDKPFLHFFDLSKCLTKDASDPFTFVKRGLSCPTPQVCVSKCTTKNEIGYSLASEEMVCKEGVNVKAGLASGEKKKLVQNDSCAPYYLSSTAAYYRCLPTVLSKAIDSLSFKNTDGSNVNGSDIKMGTKSVEILLSAQEIAVKIGDELRIVWPWILVGLLISMVLSVLYIVLARWITFPLVLVSAIGTSGTLVYGTYYSFAKYKYLVDSESSQKLVWKINMSLESFARNKNCWLVLGIVLAVLLLILLLIFIFLFTKIRLACGLIAEASRAIGSMLSTLFFPLLPWILQIAWLAWFVGVLLFLMSNGIAQYQITEDDRVYNISRGDICDKETFKMNYPNTKAACVFAKYVQNYHLLRLQIYHLVGWLWGANFIIAFGEFSLAGAFASYYWAFNKPKDIPAMPVFLSMWQGLSYHTGSLALGASIIAIVQLIRITLEYIHRKLKENTDNAVANCMMKCLKCCFWCLEKCLRFINKNAYIMIAVKGKNFCVSAKKAVTLLISNIGSTMAINGITGFVLFIGKLLITVGICVASFFWFAQYNAMLPQKLNYSIVPIIICTLGAYLVTMMFFSVYDLGIDTLFLSYLEDLKDNDGSPEKPYFMTKSLQDIMDKHNKKVGGKKPEEMNLTEA